MQTPQELERFEEKNDQLNKSITLDQLPYSTKKAKDNIPDIVWNNMASPLRPCMMAPRHHDDAWNDGQDGTICGKMG